MKLRVLAAALTFAHAPLYGADAQVSAQDFEAAALPALPVEEPYALHALLTRGATPRQRDAIQVYPDPGHNHGKIKLLDHTFNTLIPARMP